MLPGIAAMLATPDRYAERAKDWRNGAVVYQVFVDRFVPPTGDRQALYPTPLRRWSETPKATPFDPVTKGYPHTREFWGGDLAGVRTKLDYLNGLGVDVLYLQPIFRAPSNHKYDTEDYFAVDPQLGTEADLEGLIGEGRKWKMRLMLDGVFNHVGATSTLFRDPGRRDWFFFDPSLPNGYRGWAGVESLPAFRLENPKVQEYLWRGRESVVRRYLRMGIDGWRLDVAFELGPSLLAGITKAAHETKPGSAVVGEISGYPAGWAGAVDGVFNWTPVALASALAKGTMTGGQAGRTLGRMVEDAGIDALLKSWLLVENHDTARLATVLPDVGARRIAQVLQTTLPGSPCVYYGEEAGMAGGGDPEGRAPMRWDLAREENPDFGFFRWLLALRRHRPALRVGDFTPLETSRLLAYARITDKVREATLVVVNPTDETVRESFATRVGRLMSWGELTDALTGRKLRTVNGLVEVEMGPRSAMILAPTEDRSGGYSPYDRIP